MISELPGVPLVGSDTDTREMLVFNVGKYKPSIHESGIKSDLNMDSGLLAEIEDIPIHITPIISRKCIRSFVNAIKHCILLVKNIVSWVVYTILST